MSDHHPRPELVFLALTRPLLAELLDPANVAELQRIAARLDESVDVVILGSDLVQGGVGDHPGLDPTIAATVLAHHTERVGLVIAVVPQRDHPYNTARRTASIDHAANGRVGIVVGLTDHAAPAGSPWTEADAATAAVDAVAALRELWRSYPIDSIVADASRGVFAESHRIVAVDHHGPAFRTAGPLQVPWGPQVWPPVFAWAGRHGAALPAEVADVVLDADEPGRVVVAPESLHDLTAWLATAVPVPPSPGTLRDRLGLGLVDPPRSGRVVFPQPAVFPEPAHDNSDGEEVRRAG